MGAAVRGATVRGAAVRGAAAGGWCVGLKSQPGFHVMPHVILNTVKNLFLLAAPAVWMQTGATPRDVSLRPSTSLRTSSGQAQHDMNFEGGFKLTHYRNLAKLVIGAQLR